MFERLVGPAFAAAIVAWPLAGCQTATGTGAAGGAVAGAVVGGPVGAVVGGIAGATVGAAITPDESLRAREYVFAQRRPSIRVREQVRVGYRLPPRVKLHPVPPQVGLRGDYGYTIVNRRPVLVEPRTREIIYVYE